MQYFLSGGDVTEDINTHLREHLQSISDNNVPSAGTVLRGIKELTTENTIYTSETGISYNFNINNKLNELNIKLLKLTKQLEAGKYSDNQINSNNKRDAKPTYKKNTGYFPGIAAIENKIVCAENRDGNANVKFKQAETLERFYGLLISEKEALIITSMIKNFYNYIVALIADKFEGITKTTNLFFFLRQLRGNGCVKDDSGF